MRQLVGCLPNQCYNTRTIKSRKSSLFHELASHLPIIAISDVSSLDIHHERKLVVAEEIVITTSEHAKRYQLLASLLYKVEARVAQFWKIMVLR